MKPFPWRTVTGFDFARSIRWARTQPTLRDIIARVTGQSHTQRKDNK